jgi:SAM-dependent methyltransferase
MYDGMASSIPGFQNRPEIKANTYPISPDSKVVLNSVKQSYLSIGSTYFDHIDQDTLKELNKLCHPNILLYNIIRDEYILQRFITVLIYNFGYNHGEKFEENLDKQENIRISEFIKDIFNVANITFVDESTKKIYLRTKFMNRGLKQIVDHSAKANFEFDILKQLSYVCGRYTYNTAQSESNLYEWLRGKIILDIGCGPGHFLGELECNGINYRQNLYGIDVASYVQPKYRDRLILRTYEENVQFPSDLPKFDFISFFMSIHHIELYKLHLILLQLYSMLNDDGFLYVKEHLVECQEDVTFFKFMETYFYFVEEYIPNVPVEDNYYTREGMIAIFKIYGFNIVTNFEINKNQPFKPFYYLFDKDKSYNQTEISSEEKMESLVNVVADMRATNVFSNGNIFKKVGLNDFTSEIRIVDYNTILRAEYERTEMQLIRGKSENCEN